MKEFLIIAFLGVGIVIADSKPKEYQLFVCPDVKQSPDDNCSFKDKVEEADSLGQRAVVKIGNKCIDWVEGNSERGKLSYLDCADPHFYCCLNIDRVLAQGPTQCSYSEVDVFLKVWKILGFSYKLYGFDSERFAAVLTDFLETCTDE